MSTFNLLRTLVSIYAVLLLVQPSDTTVLTRLRLSDNLKDLRNRLRDCERNSFPKMVAPVNVFHSVIGKFRGLVPRSNYGNGISAGRSKGYDTVNKNTNANEFGRRSYSNVNSNTNSFSLQPNRGPKIDKSSTTSTKRAIHGTKSESATADETTNKAQTLISTLVGTDEVQKVKEIIKILTEAYGDKLNHEALEAIVRAVRSLRKDNDGAGSTGKLARRNYNENTNRNIFRSEKQKQSVRPLPVGVSDSDFNRRLFNQRQAAEHDSNESGSDDHYDDDHSQDHSEGHDDDDHNKDHSEGHDDDDHSEDHYDDDHSQNHSEGHDDDDHNKDHSESHDDDDHSEDHYDDDHSKDHSEGHDDDGHNKDHSEGHDDDDHSEGHYDGDHSEDHYDDDHSKDHSEGHDDDDHSEGHYDGDHSKDRSYEGVDSSQEYKDHWQRHEEDNEDDDSYEYSTVSREWQKDLTKLRPYGNVNYNKNVNQFGPRRNRDDYDNAPFRRRLISNRQGTDLSKKDTNQLGKSLNINSNKNDFRNWESRRNTNGNEKSSRNQSGRDGYDDKDFIKMINKKKDGNFNYNENSNIFRRDNSGLAPHRHN